MKINKLFLIFILLLFVSNTKKEDTTSVLDLNFIEEFPQKVILTRYSENFVKYDDTTQINNESERRIVLPIKKPQYVSLQFKGKVLQLYVEPNKDLKIFKSNESYRFEGALKEENAYLQEVMINPDLAKKAWNYQSPFDDFKNQVESYFKSKNEILSQFATKNNYFQNLQSVDNNSFKNSVYLSYINSQIKADKDSLFLAYFDKSLIDFNQMKPYLISNRLKSFYSQMGIDYLSMKKNGKRVKKTTDLTEHFIMRENAIAAHFPQPIKSMLLYDDLRFYALEIEYAPDSIKPMPPLEMFNKYKNDLNSEAHSALIKDYEILISKNEKQKKGTLVPLFALKDEFSKDYELNTKNFDKMILLDIWASWCGPCIKKFPEVREIETKYEDKLMVVSISLDEDLKKFEAALIKLNPPGKIRLYSENGFQGSLADSFNIKAIPRYILISKNGEIVDANIDLSDLSKSLE